MFSHDIEKLTKELLTKVGRQPEEEWRNLVLPSGIHPDYLISNHGRVISLPRWREHPSGRKLWPGKLLKPSPQQSGHMRIGVSINGKQKTIHVHRAVMWTFVGPQPEGSHVRHLDGDPANNRLDNLEYGTPWNNLTDTFGPAGTTGIGIVIGSSLERRIKSAIKGGADAIQVLKQIDKLVEKSRVKPTPKQLHTQHE